MRIIGWMLHAALLLQLSFVRLYRYTRIGGVFDRVLDAVVDLQFGVARWYRYTPVGKARRMACLQRLIDSPPSFWSEVSIQSARDALARIPHERPRKL